MSSWGINDNASLGRPTVGVPDPDAKDTILEPEILETLPFPVQELVEKQVRVVSPTRDRDGKRPIKGILKQPKQSFPEEPNPIREGVAPHKDDKTNQQSPHIETRRSRETQDDWRRLDNPQAGDRSQS